MKITIENVENGFIVVKRCANDSVKWVEHVYVFQGFAPMTVWLAEEYKAIADAPSTKYVYPG